MIPIPPDFVDVAYVIIDPQAPLTHYQVYVVDGVTEFAGRLSAPGNPFGCRLMRENGLIDFYAKVHVTATRSWDINDPSKPQSITFMPRPQ